MREQGETEVKRQLVVSLMGSSRLAGRVNLKRPNPPPAAAGDARTFAVRDALSHECTLRMHMRRMGNEKAIRLRWLEC